MLTLRIVGKKSNGDYIVRPSEDCQIEIDQLLKKHKTILSAQPFDPMRVTRNQQKIAHALIKDINDYSDNDYFIKNTEDDLKIRFCIDKGFSYDKLFSLSNCTRDLARQFISWLIEYCFHYDIPFNGKDTYLVHDTSRKMFLASVHNRCFVTHARRQDAVLHIHHVNAVGRGSRANVDHRGRYYMILRAELHDEIHQLGYQAFCAKWHVGAIKLTDQQLIDFKLMSAEQMASRDADPNYEIRDWQLPERNK